MTPASRKLLATLALGAGAALLSPAAKAGDLTALVDFTASSLSELFGRRLEGRWWAPASRPPPRERIAKFVLEAWAIAPTTAVPLPNAPN
jgi:hypothetical protein